MYELVWTI